MAETVLLVDHDPDVLRSVGAFLEHAGYPLVRAETADEALAAASRERPDVVVLDLQLPDASGLDVLERCSSACSRSWPPRCRTRPPR